MRYLDKVFTLPAGSNKVTQKRWNEIFKTADSKGTAIKEKNEERTVRNR